MWARSCAYPLVYLDRGVGVPLVKITAGELALHPVACISLAVLVVNDHWLKSACPGLVTGKLSDCAGLVLLPIGLASLTEILRRICGRPLIWRYDALIWVALSVLGFAFVKTSSAGNDAYAWVLGGIRWPLQALSHDSRALQIRPIIVSRDPADLLALAVSPWAFLLIRKTNSRRRDVTRHPWSCQ
jgi:hypothetical protein